MHLEATRFPDPEKCSFGARGSALALRVFRASKRLSGLVSGFGDSREGAALFPKGESSCALRLGAQLDEAAVQKFHAEVPQP
eukprot:14628604-Alexandrium_andersonii.AAC.1